MEELINNLDEHLKQKATALIDVLDNMQLGQTIQEQGLLYFLYFNKQISKEEITAKFESHLPTIEVLEKLDSITFSLNPDEAENLRKMFFAITKDIRIIMIKIALVVVDSRFYMDLEENERLRFANAIFLLFAPLAARLGLSTLKTELENTAFYISDSKKFMEIQDEVDKRFHKRQPIVDELKNLTKECMEELGIEGKVYGRKKHIYSIYKKMANHSLDTMYDLVAVRAIVNTVSECYALLGKLHTEVEPLPNRFKDYIATPKPNGYQSLHTTVNFEGYPVEIQIRTQEMHRFAEYGVAAHWLYKEKRNKQDILDYRLAWLRQMMENENVSIDDLANSLNEDIYGTEIFVMTPKGKIVYLPIDSTPIDFAYSVHSEIGNKMVGAKVNDKMVPTDSVLNNGDVVEIITSPNSKGPSRDWLKVVKSSEAKKKINDFFKHNMKDETLKIGKTMLENAIKEKGFAVSKIINNKSIQEVVDFYNLSELDELYINIGTNSLKPKVVANKFTQSYQQQIKKESINEATPNVYISSPTENMIAVKGLNNTIIKFAGCCKPIYNDDIIGFISTGRGIIIHRKQCPNVNCFDDERLIETSWKPITEKPKKTRKPKNKEV